MVAFCGGLGQCKPILVEQTFEGFPRSSQAFFGNELSISSKVILNSTDGQFGPLFAGRATENSAHSVSCNTRREKEGMRVSQNSGPLQVVGLQGLPFPHTSVVFLMRRNTHMTMTTTMMMMIMMMMMMMMMMLLLLLLISRPEAASRSNGLHRSYHRIDNSLRMHRYAMELGTRTTQQKRTWVSPKI